MLASADLTFFDFETRGRGLDLKAVGTPAYAASAEAIVCAFAIGEGPAQVWHAEGAILDWNDAPAALKRSVEDGALLAAWNASFDSTIWNYATLGFPFLDELFLRVFVTEIQLLQAQDGADKGFAARHFQFVLVRVKFHLPGHEGTEQIARHHQYPKNAAPDADASAGQ